MCSPMPDGVCTCSELGQQEIRTLTGHHEDCSIETSAVEWYRKNKFTEDLENELLVDKLPVSESGLDGNGPGR